MWHSLDFSINVLEVVLVVIKLYPKHWGPATSPRAIIYHISSQANQYGGAKVVDFREKKLDRPQAELCFRTVMWQKLFYTGASPSEPHHEKICVRKFATS